MPLQFPPGLALSPDQPNTEKQQKNALRNAGVGPLYLHVNHQQSNFGILAAGRSSDGINITPIGDTVPFVAPGVLTNDHVRDPIVFYYKPTREFFCIYTHSGTGTPGYAQTLGLCKSRNLSRWDYVAEIPINGTGLELDPDWFVWSGHVIIDNDGQIYATLSVLPGGVTTNLIIGWIKFNDPGNDWTDVTDFKPMTDDNPNFAAFVGATTQNNDMCVVWDEDARVYRYFFDSGPNGAHEIYRAESAYLFAGMSVPVSLGLRALVGSDIEGQYVVRNPTNDGYILYLQIIFGPVNYCTSPDLVTWTTPAPLNWPAQMAIGNGSAIKIEDIDAAHAVMSAQEMRVFLDTNNVNCTTRIKIPSGTFFALNAAESMLGNGASGDVRAYQMGNSGGIVSHILFGDILFSPVAYTGYGCQVSGADVAFRATTLTGLPRLWLQRDTMAHQFIILGDNNLYLIGNANTGGAYVAMKLEPGILTLGGPEAGAPVIQIGPKGLKAPTNAADVASGAWYDNAGVWTKKP